MTADYAAITKNYEAYKTYASELERRLSIMSQQQQTQEVAQSVNNKNDDHQQLVKEHEDLLVLLAEQDSKINSYKQRLRALGEAVSDDEAEA